MLTIERGNPAAVRRRFIAIGQLWADGAAIGLLLVAHVLLRLFLLPQIPNHMVGGFSEVVARIYARNPLALLLPIPIETARQRIDWTTTGLVLVEAVRRCIGLEWTYIVAAGIFIVAGYAAARLLSGSRSIAFTFAGLFVVGTQLNYVYFHPHIGAFYLYYLYITVNLLALARMLQGDFRARWRVSFVVSLVATALFLEIWLNYALFLLAFLPLVAYWANRRRDHPLLRRSLWSWSVALAVVVVYVAVRADYRSNLFTPGSEEELITTYSYVSLAVTDFVSNVITYLFISFSTYLPSVFLGSYPLIHLGAAVIKREQNGFATPYLNLVVAHNIFFWYYYAGMVFAAYWFGVVSALRRAFRPASAPALAVVGILLLILTGCASLSLIKYRYYVSVPVIAYKCVTGTFGVAVLIAFGLEWIRRHCRQPTYAGWLIGVWVVALATFVTHASAEVALLRVVGFALPSTPPLFTW